MELVRNCQLFVSVSHTLLAEYHDHPNTMVIPHGVPSALLNKERMLSAAVEKKIIMAGSVSYRTDIELLHAVAVKLPEYTLKIAGPLVLNEFSISDHKWWKSLLHLPNVKYTGVLSFVELAGEIYTSCVGIAAYKQNDPGNSISYLKIMQYLACGKPVVTTPLIEYSSTRFSEMISVALSKEEFVADVERMVSNEQSEADKLKRSSFASEFKYSLLLGLIARNINSEWP